MTTETKPAGRPAAVAVFPTSAAYLFDTPKENNDNTQLVLKYRQNPYTR